jgi:hypothetical protein
VGYLLRLVELNDYDTVSWILQLAGIKDYSHSKFGFVFDPSLILSPLSRLTGVDEAKLTPLLYQPVKEPGQAIAVCHLVFGSPIPQYLIRPRRAKICPACLRESDYARKVWEITPVTVCPIHRVLLLDECPKCKKSVNWNRTSVSRCACGYDWRKLKPDVIECSELRATKQVFRLCGLSTEDGSSDSEDTHNPLYGLGLEQFLSALFFIAGQYEGLIDTKGKKLAPSRRSAEMHSLLCRAFAAFEDWPNNYFSFLDWRRDNTPDTRHSHGLRRDFNQYKYALYVRFAADCYRFLRDAFEEYIAGHWNGGYMTSLTRLNDEARQKKKYLSKAEAARRVLKISVRFIDGLIAAGKLQTVERQQGGRKILLVEADSVWRLKDELSHPLYLRQAARKLGTHEVGLQNLVEAGLLHPLRGPTVDGCSDWTFGSKEVNSLINLLEQKVSKVRGATEGKQMGFYSALKSLQPLGIRLGAFVKDILQNRIVPCGRCGERAIQDLVFLYSDIEEYRGAKLRDIVGDVLLIREAATILGISVEAIYYLVRLRLLRAQSDPRVKGVGLLVSREDLESFRSSYITLGTMAAQQNTNKTYIVRALCAKGVSPVSGPSKDGGLVSVFRKVDLSRAGLAYLWAGENTANIPKKMSHVQ